MQWAAVASEARCTPVFNSRATTLCTAVSSQEEQQVRVQSTYSAVSVTAVKMWRRARQPMGCGRLLSSPLNRSSWTDPAPGEHPVLLYSGPASDAHASRLPDAPLQRLHSTTKPPPPSAARPAQRWPQSSRHHWQILICSVHGDSHLPTLHCMILTDDSQNGGWEERASINYVEKKYTIHNVTAFYPLQTSLRCGRCP